MWCPWSISLLQFWWHAIETVLTLCLKSNTKHRIAIVLKQLLIVMKQQQITLLSSGIRIQMWLWPIDIFLLLNGFVTHQLSLNPNFCVMCSAKAIRKTNIKQQKRKKVCKLDYCAHMLVSIEVGLVSGKTLLQEKAALVVGGIWTQVFGYTFNVNNKGEASNALSGGLITLIVLGVLGGIATILFVVIGLFIWKRVRANNQWVLKR